MLAKEITNSRAIEISKLNMNRAIVEYDEYYTSTYAQYYIVPWPLKHQINYQILQQLLAKFPDDNEDVWLDTCCGQAWHFKQFPDSLSKLGIDRSQAQLSRARTQNPDAWFVCADIAHLPLPASTFALVTNFWGSYCYLNDPDAIACMFHQLCASVRLNGWIYFEILLPNDLATFNESDFALSSGFQVSPVNSDFHFWEYRDIGGLHRMCSPPLSMFLSILSEMFHGVHYFHDGSFITHLIGSRRR